MIRFHPDAVVYKIDKDLISSLIENGAFRGLRDGREEDLGEAHIVGFKIHHSSGAVDSHDVKLTSLETDLSRHLLPLMVVAAAGLVMGISICRSVSRCRAGRVEYQKLLIDAATTAA